MKKETDLVDSGVLVVWQSVRTVPLSEDTDFDLHCGDRKYLQSGDVDFS